MANCESCGMLLEPGVAAYGLSADKYCKYCTDEEGNLKSREAVREGMINFYKSQGKSPEEAEQFVDSYMQEMPAWQDQ